MNAHAPLRIIALENCWEHAHPDVVFVPEGFAGYPYWMTFTPYPLMNDRFENPTIRASHDGVKWQRVEAISDPLVQPPGTREMHHADPELVYRDGSLYLVYVTIRRETDEVTFSSMNCKRDLRWSEPQVIHEDVGAVSPTFQVSEDTFHEWFIRADARDPNRSELIHCEGPDLASLGHEHRCEVDIPGHVAWHVDVLKVKDDYEALIPAFRRGTDNTRTRLFHLTSKDGLSFALTRERPIIEPSSRGWDDRMIYRSTFLKGIDGTYRIWYSAGSWGCHFGIGLLQGSLDSLEEPVATFAPVPNYLRRLPGELDGRLRYEIRRRLPSRVLSVLPTQMYRHGQR